MKVCLPAIEGHVPSEMVRTLSTFLDFCYYAQRNSLNESVLGSLERALECFHHHCHIFQETGVCEHGLKGFSLPCQHSMMHYRHLSQEFGTPNGLCSSITESKHIKAVKKPWQCSNHFEALGQMLVTNQRLDKLAAAQVDLKVVACLMDLCSQQPCETLNYSMASMMTLARTWTTLMMTRSRQQMMAHVFLTMSVWQKCQVCCSLPYI